MRTIILFLCLLLSFSFTSCSKKRLKRKYKGNDKNPKQHSLEIGNVDNRQMDVALDVDKMFFVVRGQTSRRRTVDPVCRGVEGCLHICEHLQHHSECKQLLVHQVVDFWINQINQYPKWDSAQKDLQLIATDKDVASFLKKVDPNHYVVKSLLRMGVSAHCPISMNLGIQHAPFASLYIAKDQTPIVEDRTASVAVASPVEDLNVQNDKPKDVKEGVLSTELEVSADSTDAGVGGEVEESSEVAESPEVAESSEVVAKTSETKTFESNFHSAWDHTVEKRKIIDSSVVPFDANLFFSFIKKCFGEEPRRTFVDVATEIENRPAFDIAHDILKSACHDNSECIRLAYCDINSQLVWDQVDPKYKDAGCKYDSFIEPIPPAQARAPAQALNAPVSDAQAQAVVVEKKLPTGNTDLDSSAKDQTATDQVSKENTSKESSKN